MIHYLTPGPLCLARITRDLSCMKPAGHDDEHDHTSWPWQEYSRRSIEVDTLPPTQNLVMELLAARHRLGETVWTLAALPGTVRALRVLEEEGLVGWKDGVVEHTALAWLTDSGRAAVLSPNYVAPTVKGNPVIHYLTPAQFKALRRPKSATPTEHSTDQGDHVIRYLSRAQFAEALGCSADSLSRYRLPPPDAWIGHVRGWSAETVAQWIESRPGQGARTDLVQPPTE